MSTVNGDFDALSRAIQGEAQAEVEDVISRSKEQAQAILARARVEADAVRGEILEKARQDARRLSEQSKATAQLKARTVELEHREKILAGVFDAAGQRLHEASSRKDFGGTAGRLLREALAQLKTKSATIRADRATQAAFTKSELDTVSRELQIELHMGEPLEGATGVVAQSPDGRLKFDNTLENRLARMQATLRSEVFRILTGATK